MTIEIHLTNTSLSFLLKPTGPVDKAALDLLYSNMNTGKKLSISLVDDTTYVLGLDLTGA